jgi:hypothetical protein
VRQLLTSTKTTTITLICLSDLAPCDFFLFSKTKSKLKGRRFESIEELQAELQGVVKMLTQRDSQQGF